MAQTIKHLSTMRETWVQSLGWEDPLEKEKAIHSSNIAWKIPWTEEPGRPQSMGWQRVGHDWATSLHFTSINSPVNICNCNPVCGVSLWKTMSCDEAQGNLHTIMQDWKMYLQTKEQRGLQANQGKLGLGKQGFTNRFQKKYDFRCHVRVGP